MQQLFYKSPIAKKLAVEHTIDDEVLAEFERVLKIVKTLAEIDGAFEYIKAIFTEDTIIFCFEPKKNITGDLYMNKKLFEQIIDTQNDIDKVTESYDAFAASDSNDVSFDAHIENIKLFSQNYNVKSKQDFIKNVCRDGRSAGIILEDENGKSLIITPPIKEAFTNPCHVKSDDIEMSVELDNCKTVVSIQIHLEDGYYIKLEPSRARQIVNIKPGYLINFKRSPETKVATLIDIYHNDGFI